MLNNDIVGNTVGQGGVREARWVRVFSEGIRASEDLPQQLQRRGNGGEDDGPSRALAKAIDGVADKLGGWTCFSTAAPTGSGAAAITNPS